MPDVIEMLRTLPDAVTPGPVGPDLAAADVARGHRALGQRRRRRLAGVAGVAAVGAVAAVLTSTSAPRSATPVTSASRRPAVTSPLMILAARLSTSDRVQQGDASLEIIKTVIGGKPPQFYYGLYTDSGKLYSGDSRQTLMAAIAQHANLATAYDSEVVAAARDAATGSLAAARMKMIDATQPDPAKVQYSNVLWTNATYALTWGGGDAEIRAGVLRLLSTISAVKVEKSTTGGQPTLTISAGPGAFGGMGNEVLVISATTGLTVSVSNLGPSAGVEHYQVSRVTLANVEAGKF